MSKIAGIFAVLILAGIAGCSAPQETERQPSGFRRGEAPMEPQPVSIQLFYDELSPYGQWVNHPAFGYVWLPAVDPGFSPYATNGHWVFTDYGWTWYSDYRWGWAPFHYGRWDYDDAYGWFWVPRTEWAPAWVSWRRAEGYYGWAPMGPGMDVNAAISSGYGVPNDRWVFVGERDFVRPDVDHYYIERSRNVTIINNSAVINYTYVDNSRHVTYVSGPRGDDVQRVTGAPVKRVVIQEYDRPGQNLSNDQLHIYRPRVQSNTGSGRNPVPPRVRDLDEVRRSPGGNSRPPGQQYGSPSNPGRELAPPRGKEERTPPALDQDRGTKPPAQGGSGYPPKPPTDPSRVRQPQVERNNGMLRQPPNAAPVNPNRGKGKVPRTPRTDQERLKRKKPAPQQAVPPVPPNGRKEREGRDSVKKE